MRLALLLAPALLAATPAAAQHATEEDSAAVLAAVDSFFGMIDSRDPSRLGSVTVPDGLATGTLRGPDGTAAMQAWRWSEFGTQMENLPEGASERLVDPHVHVDGDIAMIWSEYVFTINGELLHCGIDHFDMVRIDGAWKINNLTWTQRTENCPAVE